MTNWDDRWPVLKRPVIFRSGWEECYYKHFRTHNTPESVFVGSIVDEASFWCQFHYLQNEDGNPKAGVCELWKNVVETLRQGLGLGSNLGLISSWRFPFSIKLTRWNDKMKLDPAAYHNICNLTTNAVKIHYTVIIFWSSSCVKWENDLQKAISGPNSYLNICKFRPRLKHVVTKGATYGETNDSVGHCDFEVLTGGSKSAFSSWIHIRSQQY